MRIIRECKPDWFVIENPANGALKSFLGRPKMIYNPWEFGSPWTKKTALWGKFNIPEKIYKSFYDIPESERNIGLKLYPNKKLEAPLSDIPSLTQQGDLSVIKSVKEFEPFLPYCKTLADYRSLCSQKFAQAFKNANP